MSAESERVRKCLTRQWQTTGQIVDKAGLSGDRRRQLIKVYHYLSSDAKYGLVEKSVIEHVGRCGKTAIWKLPEAAE